MRHENPDEVFPKVTSVINKWPISGVLLYQGHRSDWADRLLSFFRSKSTLLEVKGIEGEEIIRRVVPGYLSEGEDLWLCLFSTNQPNEVLVVPLNFIDDYNSQLLESELTRKLEVIRGKITQPWTPLSGYANYSFFCRNKGETPRAGVLSLRRPLNDLTIAANVDGQFSREGNPKGTEQSEIIKFFVGGTEKTLRWREEFLSKVLESEGDSRYKRVLEEFEERLLNESLSLFESTRGLTGNAIVLPRIVKDLGDAMDEETKKFLVSSKNVEVFASKNLPGEFDFSLPGSGVWKAVERELNASVIWNLRRSRNIVGDNPWVTSRHNSEEFNIFTNTTGRKVNLNRREKNGSHRLGGIMLGEIAHILLYGEHNGVKEDFDATGFPHDLIQFLTHELPNNILKVSSFRNKNAHISAMSKRDYTHLSELVLGPENEPQKSLLGSILSLKQKLRSEYL